MEMTYTTQLQAGTGMIDETKSLLGVWQTGMTAAELSQEALESGIFPNMSARRIRNLVVECFAPRYLVKEQQPAAWVKQLQGGLSRAEFAQLLFLYTCRANEILSDFVKQVYWMHYSAGKSEIERQDAINFVVRSNQDGKTASLWSDSTVRRVSSYLISCCANFGLIEDAKRKNSRKIFPYRVENKVCLFLLNELHLQFKCGDNAIINHPDWQLFGLESAEVIEQLKAQMVNGHLVVQSAGGLVNVAWKYKNMQELVDAIIG